LPLFTLDRGGVIQQVNHAGAERLGLERSRLLGRLWRSFVAGDDRRRFAQLLARSRAGGEGAGGELQVAPPEGSLVPVRLWLRLAPGAGGLLLLAAIDLRERDGAVAQMQRLVESERVARREIAAKDQFIAMLSHELRTPLTPVLAAASLMSGRRNLSVEVLGAFQMIRRNVSIEARIIDDLLDVTRIASGKMSVRREPTDVHQLALDTVEILGEEARRKRHTIAVDLAAERHQASADPVRLRQVFWNLLRNAIKFTPDGGEIHLRTWNAGSRMTIEIEDSGVGIDPQDIPQIFEPFRQIDEDRLKRTTGGLGLGLSICKGLIDLHGGQIAAHSRGRGQGARFVVQLETLSGLPARADAAPPAAAAPLPPPAPERVEAGASAERKRRILLVDDHPDTVAMMTDLLIDSGYDVESAQSVRAALAVDLQQVDMIVSDIGLPDGTGLDLIRSLQSRGHRPAIALSGFGMESDVRASKEAGFDLHLTKPVDIDDLLGAIRALNSPHPG
jgi:PAS domain S-box-containing protein